MRWMSSKKEAPLRRKNLISVGLFLFFFLLYQYCCCFSV